jgi:hypothetical protein
LGWPRPEWQGSGLIVPQQVSLPFHPSLPLSVTIPMNDLGKVDIYPDDSIGVVPDIDDNARRVNRAIPLAIHALPRPLSDNECFPRKDIISLKKFTAEGTLEEEKLV